MKIISITGKLKVEDVQVTKSIGGLILGLSFPVAELLNEKISIYIERANGNNFILANKIMLKDFISLASYGAEALQCDATYPLIAICEIAKDGGIHLAEGERIKISFDDLRSAQTYDVYGIEEPNPTNTLFVFEQKSISSEEFNKKIDTRGFDLAVMTEHETISDLSYTFGENGGVVKYLPFELQTMSRDLDPIQAILQDGTVLQNHSNRLMLPLVEVDSIEVNKEQGAIINFVMRTTKNAQ
jgi:hypothetical protein